MNQISTRSLVPAEPHQKIFETYNGLAVADTFVLVNDHDPLPLYYPLDAEHKGEFSWRYPKEEPQGRRAEIGRTRLAWTEIR